MPDWPALIIALILSIYWVRVRRLARKIRKSTGHGANFRPRERVGQLLRWIWVPVVTIWVSHPYVTALMGTRPAPWLLTPLVHSDIVSWLAVVAAASALAGSMVCWKRMGKSWRMGIDPDEKTQLIVSGPYAYVRHPIYALSSLLMLATLAAVPSPLMLMAGFLHLLLLQWEARREEKYLLVHHGQSYAEYCRRVGRFVPRSLQGFHPNAPLATQGAANN